MRERWRRLTGPVRVRTTLVATAVVAVALVVGGIGLVWALNRSLDGNRAGVAAAQVADIATLAASGHLPPVLASANDDTTLAQVIDGHDRVLASSANVRGDPAVVPFSATPGQRFLYRSSPVSDVGPALLVTQSARLGSRPIVVVVAVSLEPARAALRTVIIGLCLGFPPLLALVAVTTWLMTGRTLRPIDDIRAEVAEITNQDLHRRVPTPPTGDEVGRLAGTMNSMLDRLERAYTQQQRFVADASHELRSPLASMRTTLEVALAGGAATDWPAAGEDLLADERRMERLVVNLLALNRLEAEPPVAGTEAVDLGRVVKEELRRRPSRPEGDGPVVRAEVPDEIEAAISGHQARQVVANLLDNAERHARRCVEVTLSVCAAGGAAGGTGGGPGGAVELVVTDDGPGIPADQREVVFERFTRLDPARRADDGGAGLGLAIVRDIVVRHGGSVRFTDAPVGARAVVTLPRPTAPASPTGDLSPPET